MRRQYGGQTAQPPAIGGIAPSAYTQNPVVQGMLQRFQNMTPEQLQQAAMMLGQSPQGQMAQRLLMARRMMPNVGQQAPVAGVGSPASLAAPSTGIVPSLGGVAPMRSGGALHRQFGGMSATSPWWERSEARSTAIADSGLLNSPVGGRSDHIALNVPDGAYVIPADVVSGLGEGNTLAGARVISEALGVGPYGTGLPHSHAMGHTIPGGAPLPHPPTQTSMPVYTGSRGGRTGHVPVLAAGGEYVVSPHHVALIGGGNIRKGHEKLDKWVVGQRKKVVGEMKALPGPAK